MKGPEAYNEIEKSYHALRKLNCSVVKTDEHTLPTGDTRVNILIRKDKDNPTRYPRDYKEIKARPL